MEPAGAGIAVEPHGTRVVRERGPGGPARRVRERDRYGHTLTTLRWNGDGTLAEAWIKIADDSWVMIEPRAAYERRWGLCDRLWHAVHPSAAAHVPLTLVEAVAYDAVDRVPVVLEPARLPPGAGAAVLNLLASLAVDAGRPILPYRGPYPTEALFLILLESFRYDTAEADPLAAFVSGRVGWAPAPHERACPAPGVTVHVRGRVEKVVWRERVYYRADWQGVRRHAPRRVRDADGAVACSLWALGEPLEDHLRLDDEGGRVEWLTPPPAMGADRPIPDAVCAGVASAAAALGAPALAALVREMAGSCRFAWTSLDGDLVAVERGRVGVSHRLRDALVSRVRAAPTRAARLAVGLAALTELAHLIADPLRARAQARVAVLSADAQRRLLTETPDGAPDDAARIARAVDALVRDVEL